MLPKIPTELETRVRSAEAALKSWLVNTFPAGMILRWKEREGKGYMGRNYGGRLCRVKHAIIINEPDGSWTIGIRVETRRKNDNGFVDYNDEFHKTYHDAHAFFELHEEAPSGHHPVSESAH